MQFVKSKILFYNCHNSSHSTCIKKINCCVWLNGQSRARTFQSLHQVLGVGQIAVTAAPDVKGGVWGVGGLAGVGGRGLTAQWPLLIQVRTRLTTPSSCSTMKSCSFNIQSPVNTLTGLFIYIDCDWPSLLYFPLSKGTALLV